MYRMPGGHRRGVSSLAFRWCLSCLGRWEAERWMRHGRQVSQAWSGKDDSFIRTGD